MSKVEFTPMQELENVVMEFLTQNTVDGNLCFVKNDKTIVALVNKKSLESKEDMMILFKLVSQQLQNIIGEEKCKNIIKLPGQL